MAQVRKRSKTPSKGKNKIDEDFQKFSCNDAEKATRAGKSWKNCLNNKFRFGWKGSLPPPSKPPAEHNYPEGVQDIPYEWLCEHATRRGFFKGVNGVNIYFGVYEHELNLRAVNLHQNQYKESIY